MRPGAAPRGAARPSALGGRERDAELAAPSYGRPRYGSLPGLGVVLGARVLAEFGDDPKRYADAKARKNYAGTSPITRASGTKRTVLARQVHNDRLSDAVHQWASALCVAHLAPVPTTTR